MALRIPGRGRSRRRRSQALPDSPLEAEIAGEIMRTLRALSFDVSSTQQTRASRQTVGMPDLYVSHEAWRVRCWIEVKRPGERPTPAQHAWHNRERAAGGIVLVCTSAMDALTQINRLRVRTG